MLRDLSWLNPPFMKREIGGDGLGPEGAGIFLFIDQLDSAHPDAVVIEEEILGARPRDVGSRFSVVCRQGGPRRVRPLKLMVASLLTTTFMADEEDLIEFCPWKVCGWVPFQGRHCIDQWAFLRCRCGAYGGSPPGATARRPH